MGHIVNPNIYRLGKMVPWVSSGFKRKKNERSKVANEDFLIYNFTRNFFYKKVYKKVIGKIKKIKLKVRQRKQARKSKRKRKFGKTALLNHWIIKYSHLTITRFNKTFQLNLFFFDRELQKKYRLRHKRSKSKIRKKHLRFEKKKIKILKKKLESKLNKQKRKLQKVLTTKVHFNGIASVFKTKQKPNLASLSQEMAFDIKNIIKAPKQENINYSLARELRKKGDKREKVYIYKDNTFEQNKVKQRLQSEVAFNNINEKYKNLYFNKTIEKLYYRSWLKKYTPDIFLPKEKFYVDSYYFKNQAKNSNRFLYYKSLASYKKSGVMQFLAYNKTKRYIDNIRKQISKSMNISSNIKNINPLKGRIMDQVMKRFEQQVDTYNYKLAARKIQKRTVVKNLKKKELWKKHYLRIKGLIRYRRRKRFKRRKAINFAKRIMRKNKRI
jgi:hypothetical protein